MANSLNITIETGSEQDEVKAWTIEGLRRELDRFEQVLQANGYAANSVQTYVDRSGRFVSWLAGEYSPKQQEGTEA